MVDTGIVHVEVLPGYRVRLRFRDGTQGEVDLSGHVAKGVFSRLRDHAQFAKVRVSEHGGLAWDDDLDLCSDALYMRITGMTADQVFSLGKKAAHA